MEETAIYEDDDPIQSGRNFGILGKESPTVNVYPGRLKVGNDYFSLAGVTQSTIHTSLNPISNEPRNLRIGLWVLMVGLIAARLLFLLHQGDERAFGSNELFRGWWIVGLLYVCVRWIKYKGDAKTYYKADLVLKRAEGGKRINIASYLPRIVVSEERYLRWHRYPADAVANEKSRWKSEYEANVLRVEKIREAVGNAIT